MGREERIIAFKSLAFAAITGTVAFLLASLFFTGVEAEQPARPRARLPQQQSAASLGEALLRDNPGLLAAAQDFATEQVRTPIGRESVASTATVAAPQRPMAGTMDFDIKWIESNRTRDAHLVVKLAGQ
jgi:hypothetical protein